MTQRRSGQRPKKRRPPLNRHVADPKQKEPRPGTSAEKDPERPSSASKRKIDRLPLEVEEERKNWSGYRVVDIDKIFKDITALIVCKECHNPITITQERTCSLSSTFEATCAECGLLKSFSSSEFVSKQGNKQVAEVNRRFTYAMRSIGRGHTEMEKFSALMDFPPAVTRPTYTKAMTDIHQAVNNVAEESMLRGIEEEVEETGSNEISVSGDGSWQRRGHTSKNGIVSLIGLKTGKVLDIEVMSTVCRGCSSYTGPTEGEEFDEWWEGHQADCDVNHEGSAGSMESAGMTYMFRRSEHRGKVKYTTYVGDGDSSTYPNLVKDQPYGPNCIPQKVECTGHVQKRMGTRLRKIKKDYGKKKLKDNKTIGGRGRLTDKKIDMIASYYGNAVRGSKSIEEMRDSIWATFHHYRSTDKNPQHQFCPKGADTWCKYNKAVCDETVQKFKHKSSIPEAIMDVIKPVFEDLSKQELLERCIGGHTQNSNESLNALIWKFLPKTVFCTRKVIEIGAKNAVLIFNDGQRGHIQVLRAMKIVSGPNLVAWVKRVDKTRIDTAETRALQSTKEARKARRRLLMDQQEHQAEEEDMDYASGAF